MVSILISQLVVLMLMGSGLIDRQFGVSVNKAQTVNGDVVNFPCHLAVDLTCDWLTARTRRSSQSQQRLLADEAVSNMAAL